MPSILKLSLLVLTAVLLSACTTVKNSSAKHPLVGAWKASDNTVFLFREDGTFHGYDYRNREIWGNWVTLSPERIGFQSLMHDNYYRPQYAIIDKDDPDSMDYIITGGNGFIPAKRIPTEAAESIIEVTIEDSIHYPDQE